MEMSTESMKQSFRERLFLYQTAVPADRFEDDVRSIAAIAAELLANNTRAIKLKPADYGISNDAADFLYHFNADLQDDELVFVPGRARDTAVRAFGQAAASMDGFSDLAARFGLEHSSGSPSIAAGRMYDVHTPRNTEAQSSVSTRSQSRRESWGRRRDESSSLVTSTPSRGHGNRDSSSLATERHEHSVSGVPQSIPPTDNRFADLQTPPTLPPLTGLHVVEIMEEFSYHLFTLTTRIPFRFLFKQCQRLVTEYATDDILKLFNVVCHRIEQAGECLHFWSSEDIQLASMSQSENDRATTFYVIKSTVRGSLEKLGSEQQLDRQTSDHYSTIWQLKEDFSHTIRVFWQESSTNPTYVMFLFDLHQKLAYVNVKWTLGLTRRLSQETNARDRTSDSRDAQQMLDVTCSVPNIFTKLYTDALKTLRLYCTRELRNPVTGKEHMEHISLVRWLSDNAKSNVVRPTTDVVLSYDVGVASDSKETIKLLECHGLQSTSSVYDDAQEISANSFAMQEGDDALQLALEMSKQDAGVREHDGGNQSEILCAPLGDTDRDRHLEREGGTDRTISQHSYAPYEQFDASVDSSLLSNSVFLLNDRGNNRSFGQRDGQRSQQMENRDHNAQSQQQQGKVVAQQERHSSSHRRRGSDSGLVTNSSGLDQSTSETGVSRSVNSPSEVRDGRSARVSSPDKSTTVFSLPRYVETDVNDKADDYDSLRVASNEDEETDSGDSRITCLGEESKDDDTYDKRERQWHSSRQSEDKTVSPVATHSLPVAQESMNMASSKDTMLEHDAEQILELIRRKEFVKVARALTDLRENVKQKLTLRNISRDFLLKVVQDSATNDDLAEIVEKLIVKDRVKHETLKAVCDMMGIDVGDQSVDKLKHLIISRAKEK